ncbi:MAG TPA: hypothetical protein VMI73_06305 [Trebonia sp.]|nr:hypothetical protein [Trebonia sp.]
MAHSTNSGGRAADLALLIAPRFCGPPGSGNGGYVSGRVAAYVASACLNGPVTVTLRKPPPLDTPMAVERDGDGALRLTHDGTLIADAAPAEDGPALDVPEPVSAQQAHAAAGRAAYYADPVFPGCFVCGMDRGPGDGLRIFPGQVAGRPLWAAPWTPDKSVTDGSGTVRPEMVWAALDCPSGIAAAEAAGLSGDTAILLGRMTATLAAPVAAQSAALPAAGDECRVIAWPVARDGRKLTAGSALLAPDGTVLAAASTVWLTMPRRDPARPGEPVPASRAGGAS